MVDFNFDRVSTNSVSGLATVFLWHDTNIILLAGDSI